jgi:small subunit ribosomal protein S19
MSRSTWKLRFQEPSLSKSTFFKNYTMIRSRRSTISSHFQGKSVKVYNGHTFLPIIITKAMIGHKFGEFAFTRVFKPFVAKKIKKK